jgi:hypothetical protein
MRRAPRHGLVAQHAPSGSSRGDSQPSRCRRTRAGHGPAPAGLSRDRSPPVADGRSLCHAVPCPARAWSPPLALACDEHWRVVQHRSSTAEGLRGLMWGPWGHILPLLRIARGSSLAGGGQWTPAQPPARGQDATHRRRPWYVPALFPEVYADDETALGEALGRRNPAPHASRTGRPARRQGCWPPGVTSGQGEKVSQGSRVEQSTVRVMRGRSGALYTFCRGHGGVQQRQRAQVPQRRPVMAAK